MPKPTTKWKCNDCQTVHDCELRAIMCELSHKCYKAVQRIEFRTEKLRDTIGNFSRVSENTDLMTQMTNEIESVAKQLDEIDPNA